jgi:hypothetical protein
VSVKGDMGRIWVWYDWDAQRCTPQRQGGNGDHDSLADDDRSAAEMTGRCVTPVSEWKVVMKALMWTEERLRLVWKSCTGARGPISKSRESGGSRRGLLNPCEWAPLKLTVSEFVKINEEKGMMRS